MSRIGKNPIEVKAGVTAAIQGQDVTVKGKLGELAYRLPDGISASPRTACSPWPAPATPPRTQGLPRPRALVQNMVVGVSTGCAKTLDIEGVGFKAEAKGSSIFLSLGFANAKEYKIPQGAKVTIQNQGLRGILTESIDKQLSRVAADIRSYYPARALQGQGHPLHRREGAPQGRQDRRLTGTLDCEARKSQRLPRAANMRLRQKVKGTCRAPAPGRLHLQLAHVRAVRG